MRFKICRLGKFLVARIKRANIRSISSVYSHMSPQVEIERKTFTAPLKRTLEGLKLINACIKCTRISKLSKKNSMDINFKLIVSLPFLPCAPTDAVLVWSSQRMPCHILHIHEHGVLKNMKYFIEKNIPD